MSYAPTPGRVPAHVSDRHQVLTGNGLAVASMVLFAAGFPAADILLQGWHPIFLITVRLIMAMLAMIPLWVLIEGIEPLRWAPWIKGIRIGFFGFGLATTMLLFAQWYTDPVMVALIASTTPIAATLIEVWDGQRRLTRNFTLGLGLSVAGGVVAAGGQFNWNLGLGVLLALGSGFLFSWASNAAVRQLPTLTPIGRSTVTFAGAGVFVALLMAGGSITGLVPVPASISFAEFGYLSIYAVAAMGLSQILFIASVGRIGVGLTSFHINATPFYVMLIMVALGANWDIRALIGATIVGFGVILSQRRQRHQIETPSP